MGQSKEAKLIQQVATRIKLNFMAIENMITYTPVVDVDDQNAMMAFSNYLEAVDHLKGFLKK